MLIKKLKDMTIRGKLILGFAASDILLGALVLICMASMTSTCTKYESAYYDGAMAALQVAKAQSGFNEAVGLTGKLLTADATSDIQSLKAQGNTVFAQMGELIAGIEPSLSSDESRELYTALQTEVAKVTELMTNINATFKVGTPEKITEARRLFTGAAFLEQDAAVRNAFAKLYDNLITNGDSLITRVQKNKSRSFTVLSIAMAVIVLVSTLVVARSIIKGIRTPLVSLRDVAEKLAIGNVDVEIKRYYNDEVGQLADSMQRMVENIKQQALLTKEISQGNLCVDAEVKSPEDLMGNSLEHMISEENRVMSGVHSAVMEIKTGSQEVAAASQSLAQGSTEQASAIQQITASINDITERTRVNATEAKKASELVLKAKDDATEGNGKMRDMIGAMTEINESSENISKIIKVIDDIAFQTNILALNAAVEAARAGQHGRGFAVVADEVRNLAGKSAQAASETAELIEDSIGKVTRGSKLAEDTANALEGIVEAIDKIVTITDSIAVASNDQATAIGQIDQAIGQVSQVVQTNSATSEECAAASEELSAQAGKLREMIGRYKLKNSTFTADTQSTEEEGEETAERFSPAKDVPPVISLDDGFGKY